MIFALQLPGRNLKNKVYSQTPLTFNHPPSRPILKPCPPQFSESGLFVLHHLLPIQCNFGHFAGICGAGRKPPHARHARDDPAVTQSFLAPRKRAVCLFLPRLPLQRGGGFLKALFPCLPFIRGGGLPQARRKGFYQRPRFTTLPPRSAYHIPFIREGKDPIL